MKKNLFCVILSLMLMCLLVVPVSAGFNPETRDSVVVVNTCLDMDGGVYSFSWGTGFFVGVSGEDPQYLVTNHHVIEDFLKYGAGDIVNVKIDDVKMTGRSKIRVYYDSNDFEEAYVVDYDELKDVAILRLASPTGKRVPLKLISPTDSMVGSTVYAVGFPGLAENIFAGATTSWGKSDASVTSGTFSRLFTTSGTGQVNVQIDCVIRHGNSGGPVVNTDGAALGIATWSVSNSETAEAVNYAVSIDEAISLLKLHDVDIEIVSAASGGSAVQDPSVPGDGGTNDGGVDKPDSPVVIQKKDNTVLYIVIGVLAVVAAAIAVLIVVLKKRPAKGGGGQIPYTGPAPSPRSGMIRSLAEQHRGLSVPIQGGQAIIGRVRGECAIVFAEGTPGVSGRHCSVSFDPGTGEFILTDLKSTYGTFLENGTRLTPGVPYRLRSGDRFYLGDRANMLTVGAE